MGYKKAFNFLIVFILVVGFIKTIEAKRTDAKVLDADFWQETVQGVRYSTQPKPDVPLEKDHSFQPPSNWRFFAKGFLYFLLVAVFIVIIYHFWKNAPKNNSRNKQNEFSTFETLQEAEDNLLSTDLEKLLQEFLQAGNYKGALRLLFLQVLRHLHEQRVIYWQKQKTNRDYFKELKGHELQNAYKMAFFNFEKAWYGNTPVNAAYYNKILPVFQNIKNYKHL